MVIYVCIMPVLDLIIKILMYPPKEIEEEEQENVPEIVTSISQNSQEEKISDVRNESKVKETEKSNENDKKSDDEGFAGSENDLSSDDDILKEQHKSVEIQ